MKFVLVENPTYWWPVTIRIPDPSAAGKLIEQRMKVQFAPQNRDEALKRQEFYAALTTERDRIDAEMADMLDIVKGWDDVVDGNGNPVPFSADALRAALGKSWFRSGLNKALAESIVGIEPALGN